MIDSINIKAVLAAVVQKKIPLSAHLLIKVTDPLASTYQILDLLCDYFNSIQTIEHRKEIETPLCVKLLATNFFSFFLKGGPGENSFFLCA